jgi:O-antigen ligase
LQVYRFVLILLAVRPWLDLLFGQVQIHIAGRSISPGAGVNILVILVGVIACFDRNRLRIPRRFLLIWAPYLIISLIGILNSPQHFTALRVFLVTVSNAAMFVMAYRLDLVANDERTLCRTLLISSTIPILFTPIQFVMGWGQLGRISSVFSHPNVFAFFCMMLACYFAHCLNKGLFTDRRTRRLLIAATGLLLGCLLLTGTRSAWLATLVFGLFYCAQTRPKLLPVMILLPCLALLVPSVQARVGQIFTETNVDFDYFTAVARGEVAGSEFMQLDSYQWRRFMWQSAMVWVEKKPVLGYGLESFTFYVKQFFPITAGGADGAHNIYVQLLFELGAVGLVAYLWVPISSILATWRARRHQRPDWAFFVSLIVAYHVAAYSDNMFYYLVVNWEFWFLCGSYLVWLARPHALRAELPVEEYQPPIGQETPPRRPKHAPAYRSGLRPTTPRRR